MNSQIPLIDLDSAERITHLTHNPFAELSLDGKIARTEDVILNLLSQGKHLLCATSYGKDSSTMLNIFLQALRRYKAEFGMPPRCLVVNSNTLVENPLMDAYARGESAKVDLYCRLHDLPVSVDIVEPNLSNNYLVNIIGGRTIAVDALNDSKCSVMMKVNPINRHKNRVFREYGKANVISLVGTRFDESAERARKMKERGDSFFDISVNDVGDQVLSPIADFTLDDIFTYIGRVRAQRIECYSDFDGLVEVYRESNGGDCMVSVYATGSASNQPCGSRHGCHCCLRADDKSMVNMLKSPANSFMQPLHDFRAYLKANQYHPHKRNWLARTVKEDGTVSIAPNAYSPEYSEELLRILLTIQLREYKAAAKLGIEPRFTLLRLKDVIAIEVLWSRYGYHTAAKALAIFDEVFGQGIECDIPESYPISTPKDLPRFNVSVPFADSQYDSPMNGLRDVSAAMADWEALTVKGDGAIYLDVNTNTEFEVDEEGAELFYSFEYENFLSRYSESGICPTQVYHYFARLGTISIHKGGHKENDRMLKMASQIHRHGIRDVLNDPVELIKRLSGNESLAGLPNQNLQLNI